MQLLTGWPLKRWVISFIFYPFTKLCLATATHDLQCATTTYIYQLNQNIIMPIWQIYVLHLPSFSCVKGINKKAGNGYRCHKRLKG